MILELIEVNREVLCLLQSQQMQKQIPTRDEMKLGNVEEVISRYKYLSKQKRSAADFNQVQKKPTIQKSGLYGFKR